MENKIKISQLPLETTLKEDSLIAIVQDNSTKAIKSKDLLKKVDSEIIRINEQLDKKANEIIEMWKHIKGKKIYNVADYGIYPNGSDITEKLQKLIDLINQEGGGIVLFNDGRYVINSRLDSDNNAINLIIMKSDVEFYGSGNTILTHNTHKFYALFRNAGYTYGLYNVKFYNITFDLFIDSFPDYLINDYRCAILFDRAVNFSIEKCKFIFNGVQCIDFKTGNSIEDILIAKNTGNYFCQNIKIEDNDFIFKINSYIDYYDNNGIAMCGKNVWIEKNRFKVEIETEVFNKYPNACFEIQGENVYVRENLLEGYSNACDFNAVDEQQVYRNLVFEKNVCKNYRGLMLWATRRTMRGCIIKDNHFDLCITDKTHVASGERCCVGLTTHNRDSYDGIFKEIEISGNTFDLSSSRDFLLGLTEDEYKETDSFKILKIPFEAFYSTILLANGSVERDDIKVNNNTFIESVFPCAYIGGKSKIHNVNINDNTFKDCSYGRKYHILSLNDYCVGGSIARNNIVDTGTASLNGGLFIIANGGQYYNDDKCRFFNFEINNNNVIKTNLVNADGYTSNISKMWLSANAIDFGVNDTGSAPTFVPTKPGLHLIDRVSKKLYVSIGTASASDWICLNS